ncbi:MAG: hypothetical protein NTU76_04210 [Candidatus Taylorbacteria bacterium]|nr:hypothetical protein [Candidatus Taylorbacteria bacterium]
MKPEEIQINETSPTKERSPDYPKILLEIEEALNTGNEIEYIKERIASLTKLSQRGEMSHMFHSIHHGFIGPEMVIRRNVMVDPLTLNDDSIYTELFETIKLFKNMKEWEGKTIREIIPSAIGTTLARYFGNITAYSDTESKNREFYLNHTVSESEAVSLRELKGKNLAVCAEKAAVAENLLSFVGLESDIIASIHCRIPSEDQEVPHYFILLHAPSTYVIYDPTNPVLSLNEKREVVTFAPAMYQINDDQAKSLINGGVMKVEHTDELINKDGSKIQEKSNRTYSGPKQN